MLLLAGCDSWLDVKPDDKVLEEDLFSTRAGFNTALNGIYLGLADAGLYGKELACGFIEVVAQRYSIEEQKTGTSNRYLPFMSYSYENPTAKSDLKNVWEKMYKQIANCNNILEQALLRREVFTSEADFNRFTGKLYALRAFMHFDLFRLWGPMYSDATKGQKSIPYYKRRTSLPVALSTAGEVVEDVLGDLRTADSLMANGAGTLKMEVDKNMVRALQARVYLYTGAKEKAYETALKLVTEMGDKYPFVTRTAATTDNATDRLFYTEQIWLLENSLRNKLFEDHFDYMLEDRYYLAPKWERVRALFPDESDYRGKHWQANPGNGKSVAFLKFAKISDNSNPARTRAQSLLKISEMYLILAECAPEQAEREDYLDRLRVGRGYQQGSVSEAEANDWETTIRMEYSREFYGEGQYFFYLKRKGVSSLQSGFKDEETWTLGTAQYVLPLPESESQYR